MIKETQEKVRFIKVKFLDAQTIQKEYTNHKARDIYVNVVEKVFFKVSPMNGFMRFGKESNLSILYIVPFEILEKVAPVAYRLALTLRFLEVYLFFHVSISKRCHEDENYTIKLDSLLLDKDLAYFRN